MVEGLIRKHSKPAAEIVADELDAFAGWRRKVPPQLGISSLVSRGTIEPNDLREGTAGSFPEPSGEGAAPTSDVEPVLAGGRNTPVEGVFEESAVGANLLLGPERPGTFTVWPKVPGRRPSQHRESPGDRFEIWIAAIPSRFPRCKMEVGQPGQIAADGSEFSRHGRQRGL